MAFRMGLGSKVFGRGVTLNATVGSVLRWSRTLVRAGDMNCHQPQTVWKFSSPPVWSPSARSMQTLVVVLNLDVKNVDPNLAAVYGERLSKAVYNEMSRLRREFPHPDGNQIEGAEPFPKDEEKSETAPGSDVVSLSFEFLRQQGAYAEHFRRKAAQEEEQDLYYVKFFRDDKINRSLGKLSEGVDSLKLTIGEQIADGVFEVKNTVDQKVCEAFNESSDEMLGVVNLLCQLSLDVDVLTAASLKQDQRFVEYAVKFNTVVPTLIFWYPAFIALGVLMTDGFTPLEVVKIVTQKHLEYVKEMKDKLRTYQDRDSKDKVSDGKDKVSDGEDQGDN